MQHGVVGADGLPDEPETVEVARRERVAAGLDEVTGRDAFGCKVR